MAFSETKQSVAANLRKAADRFGQAGNRLFLNRYTKTLFFLAACAITATGQEVLGAVLFALCICTALVCCEDTTATTLPFLLLCVFVTKCYDSYDVFIGYLWLAVPVVSSLLFHFLVYRKRFVIGSSFLPMLAVSVAVLVGGIGCLSAEEYFTGGNLYYVVFLGVGMAGAYLLLKPRFFGTRKREHLLECLYLTGLFACFVIFHYVFQNRAYFLENHTVPPLQASNNLSTLLMFALPCPFLFARKNILHLASAGAMLLAILLSGSRGGMLFGTLQFFLCLAAAAVWDKKRRIFYLCCVGAFVAAVILFGSLVLSVVLGVTPENLISKEEARYQMLVRSKDLFFQYPIFGHGLGYRGNVDLYDPKTGAMTWYHMIVPQIVAGLGCVGIFAYGWQFVSRVLSLVRAAKKEEALQLGAIMTVGLSYSGILLMSLVNPGLFCPIPYALLAVILMCTVDGEGGLQRNFKAPESKLKRRRTPSRRPKMIKFGSESK